MEWPCARHCITHVPTLLGLTTILRGTIIMPILQMRKQAWRGSITCPRLHSWQAVEPRLVTTTLNWLHGPFNPAILLGIYLIDNLYVQDY